MQHHKVLDTYQLWLFCTPASSVPDPKGVPKFDQILESIRELNVLAGEGVAKIQHTTGGAKLKVRST